MVLSIESGSSDCDSDSFSDFVDFENIPETTYYLVEDDPEELEEEAWCHQYEKTVGDARIEIDDVRNDMLKQCQHETLALVEKIAKTCNVSLENLKLSHLIEFWLGDYVALMCEHVNEVQNRETMPRPIRYEDMVEFCKLEFLNRRLQTNTESLSEGVDISCFNAQVKPKLNRVSISTIRKSLDRPKYPTQPRTYDKGIEEIENFMAKKCRTGFIPEYSILALGDDKLSGNSKKLSDKLIVSKKIKKNFGPVNHAIASVMSGLYLGSRLEKVDRPLQTTMHYLITNLLSDSFIPEEDTKINNLITKDRGYNTKDTSGFCLRFGARELGTRERQSNFAFTFRDNETDTPEKRTSSNSQVLVQSSGHSVCRWASMTTKINNHNRNLYSMAWRSNGRVTLLQTTESRYGMFRWSYRTDESKSKALHIKMNAPTNSPFADFLDEKLVDIRDQVIEITSHQSTPEWFITRRFKVTSSVVGKLAGKWFSDGIASHKEQIRPSKPKLRLFTQMEKQVRQTLGFLQGGMMTDCSTKRLLLERIDVTNLKLMVAHYCPGTETSKLRKFQAIEHLMAISIPEDELDTPSTKNFHQLLHDAWFMAPVDSIGMKIGRQNETVVVDLLPLFFEQVEVPYTLQCFDTLGLILNKSHPYVATSVDGVVLLSPTCDSDDDATASTMNVISAFVEIKTRSGILAMDSIKSIPTENGGKVFFEIDIVEEHAEFKKLVPFREYRCQILHHCIAGNLNHVLYVESVSNEIIYAVLLHIPDSIKTAMLHCFYEPVNNGFIQPLLDDLSVSTPSNSIKIFDRLSISPGYAVDEVTYRQAYLLNRALMDMAIRRGKPLPPANSILPSVVDAWNHMKGGVDVCSKILANMRSTDTSMGFNGKFILRNLCVLSMNCHLTYRLVETWKEIKRSGHSADAFKAHFKTYENYKKRLNRVGSFRDFLLLLWVNINCLNVWHDRKTHVDKSTSTSHPFVGKPMTQRRRQGDANRAARNQRSLWNKGHFSNFRSEAIHPLSSQCEGDDGNSTQKQCIVCCTICCNKGDEARTHYRKGSKTVYGCFQCGTHSQQFDPELPAIPALCRMKRYKNTPGHKFDQYRDMTCFQIHHSALDYPPNPCCDFEEPKTVNSRKRRRADPTTPSSSNMSSPNLPSGGSVSWGNYCAPPSGASTEPRRNLLSSFMIA